MTNYWLSSVNYQLKKMKEIEEATMKKDHSIDMSKMKMAAAEREFANSLLSIAQKYGKLSDNDGNGIWVGYVSEENNDNYDIGVRCENCVLHESESVCKVVKNKIEPGGYCRLAAIPDGVVKMNSTYTDDKDSD